MNSVALYRRGDIPSKKDAASGKPAKKRGVGTVAMAVTPTKFHVTVIPRGPFLVIPESSSSVASTSPLGGLSLLQFLAISFV